MLLILHTQLKISSNIKTHSIMMRSLLGSSSGGDPHAAFLHIYYIMSFIASLWFVGKAFQKIGMPALVGEIVTGIVLGPNLLNIAGESGSEFLILIGEIGLIMLVVEAGIDVDIGMLKLIGPRGLGIAVLGSLGPLLIGFTIAIGLGQSIQSSIAIGSCFAPTSMGIALNVLKKAHILNTPTGQLIIAAAILDDVIALIILSELTAMKYPTAQNIILPLVVSPVLILVVGYLSIRHIPRLIKSIMTRVPEEHHNNAILGMLFMATFALVPACHFAGSSHLLGAFLSGLMFCTDHTIHLVWADQIKRILQWMLRVFFACTIGFAIPIKEFGSFQVISKGLLYCLAVVGKIITGSFGRPLDTKEFLTVGFSMSAWGEFAFIIATASYEEGTIDKESFSSVLLAVLLSVIVSPYCLSFTLSYYEKQKAKRMEAHYEKIGDDNHHPVYFAINTKARGKWGHQDKILHRIFNLELEIIDFRAWHAAEYNYSHHRPLTKESFYVMDQHLALPPTRHIARKYKHHLKARVSEIRKQLKECLGERAIVNIKRWLPGVLQQDDQTNASLPKLKRRASYCRREAFKQAHSIMSMTDLTSSRKRYTEESNRSATIPEQQEIEPEQPARQSPYSLELNPSLIRNSSEKTIGINRRFSEQIPTGSSLSSLSMDFRLKPGRRSSLDPGLFKQLSHEFSSEWHSGAGHGGQAKGAGVLPFTNLMINIHDHFDETSEATLTDDSNRSTSYIYGDEDAEHHKLPKASPKAVFYSHDDMAIVAPSFNSFVQNGSSDDD